MKRTALSLVIAVLLLAMCGTLRVAHAPSLQTLIDNAPTGSLLTVPAGNYSGPIVINKPLTLIGQGSDTVIQTDQWIQVVRINASKVTFEHFTIVGGWIGLAIINAYINYTERIEIWDISDVTVSNLTIQNSYYAVTMNQAVSNVQLLNSQLINDAEGISLQNCTGVTIRNLNITGRSIGIYFNQLNHQNTVSGTTISNCDYALIMQDSYRDVLSQNTLSNNKIGIFDLYHPDVLAGDLPAISNNLYYLNNMINNTVQVQIQATVNDRWDNGTLGNYWSNYNGTDINLDGIGDTPYIIQGTNIDHYPLMTDPPPQAPTTPQFRFPSPIGARRGVAIN